MHPTVIGICRRWLLAEHHTLASLRPPAHPGRCRSSALRISPTRHAHLRIRSMAVLSLETPVILVYAFNSAHEVQVGCLAQASDSLRGVIQPTTTVAKKPRNWHPTRRPRRNHHITTLSTYRVPSRFVLFRDVRCEASSLALVVLSQCYRKSVDCRFNITLPVRERELKDAPIITASGHAETNRDNQIASAHVKIY